MEYKVLGLDVESTLARLSSLGAAKVYDDIRTITYLDDAQLSLRTSGQHFKLTEEGKLKLSHSQPSRPEIKVFMSRKAEALQMLARLGYYPVTEVQARRVSFELGPIDFDIDIFPEIPPFMEIDLGDTRQTIAELLTRLKLTNAKVLTTSTPGIFEYYGKDYFELFAFPANA